MEKFAVGDKVKYRYDALTVDKRALLFKLDIVAEGVFQVVEVFNVREDLVYIRSTIPGTVSYWESAENIESCGSVVKIGQFRHRLVELGYSEKDISRISRVIPDA